jgi:hypothetical protein
MAMVFGTAPLRLPEAGRIGSPAVTCSSPADFAVSHSIVMVRPGLQAKFTGSSASETAL